MNNNFKKSQVLVLLVLFFLLIITLFLPSSLRPTFLYFIINFLVISLGAEAGLLSAFSNPSEDKDRFDLGPPIQKIPVISPEAVPRKREASTSTKKSTSSESDFSVEQPAPEKIIGVVKVEKVKSCASVPSLFFIGSGETEAEADIEEDAEDAEIINGKEELSAKAEAFIGNFYKQLKMQREESLQKLHGFCQKAF